MEIRKSAEDFWEAMLKLRKNVDSTPPRSIVSL